MSNRIGTWAHEVTHMLTGFGDLYGPPDHPGDFDNMAGSGEGGEAPGTHPSSYTKLKVGWLSQSNVAIALGGATETFAIRALATRWQHGRCARLAP